MTPLQPGVVVSVALQLFAAFLAIVLGLGGLAALSDAVERAWRE